MKIAAAKGFALSKLAAVGVLLGAGLLFWAGGWCSGQQPAFAQLPAKQPSSSASLVTHTSNLPDGGQQLIVVDSSRLTVCVYHVDGGSGELALKSVRDIRWDLQMSEFNGVRPLPREIKSLLESQ